MSRLLTVRVSVNGQPVAGPTGTQAGSTDTPPTVQNGRGGGRRRGGQSTAIRCFPGSHCHLLPRSTSGLRRQRLAQCLAARRDEHDQSPFIADFITAQNVDARIVTFDFDVAIIGSVPLVNDVDDADSAFVSTKV